MGSQLQYSGGVSVDGRRPSGPACSDTSLRPSSVAFTGEFFLGIQLRHHQVPLWRPSSKGILAKTFRSGSVLFHSALLSLPLLNPIRNPFAQGSKTTPFICADPSDPHLVPFSGGKWLLFTLLQNVNKGLMAIFSFAHCPIWPPGHLAH